MESINNDTNVEYISTVEDNKYKIRVIKPDSIEIKDKYELDSRIIDKTNTLLDKIIYTINNSNSQIIIIDNIEYLDNNLENIYEETTNSNGLFGRFIRKCSNRQLI